MTLIPGDLAPDFALPDSHAQLHSLSDHRSRVVIVYFYPAALTPGCTTEAIDFTKNKQLFDDAGIDIVGISPDSSAKLLEFTQKYNLAVPLLSDPNHVAINAYGVWGEKMIFGKHVEGVIRSTFIIDVDATGRGMIREALYDVKATGHVERLAAKLGINGKA